jgi:integrase
MALNETKLRNLRPRTSLYRVADANGLCIEVSPAATKNWRYRYRYTGKATMLALGTYPAVTLLEARRKRDEARAMLKTGRNPAAFVRAQRAAVIDRAANSFAAIAAEWFEQNAHRLTPGTLKRDRRVVERDLAPFLGDTPVAELKAGELLAALKRIQARGALDTAHRARSMASKMMRYAIATGRAERNPAADLIGALPTPNKEHFAAITDPKQVGELLRAIHGYSGQPATAAALKLAPMLFVRPGELRTARWADIDLDAAEWRYTATKTKTPHIVPLSSQAVAVLRDLFTLTGRNEFVFPGVRSVRRPLSENTINAALRRLGYASDMMTGHGFRAMARTILDEQLGFRQDYIEHQLAHAVRDPNGRAYNRTAHLSERRTMMQSWGDYLDALRKGANVVPLKRKLAAIGQR